MTATAAARSILTRLHEVMASRIHAQGKLDQVVEIIGESLDSEVCSIYLLREGMLELFATRGLEQSAVHVTRLAIGEGLIGTIAQHIETLNLAEAAAHPDFPYRPETGEDKFHSFAGVPIVHRERAVGSLCVQHADPRRYEDVEIEALQTVAMVLSELIAHAGLVDEEGDAVRRRAVGPAGGHRAAAGQGPRQRATRCSTSRGSTSTRSSPRIPRPSASGSISRSTRCASRSSTMASQAEFGIGGEHEEVLETYKMFAYDEGWGRRINEAIDSGLTAEAAIERVQQRTRMRMREIDDPLLADRMHDLEDLVEPPAADRLGPARHRGIAGPASATRS